MARKNEEYDWLNDPFDEKKIAQDQQQAHMSNGSKVAVGCGCLVALVAILGILLVGGIQFFSVLSA